MGATGLNSGSVLEKVSRAMTRNYGIDVIFEGSEAKTDMKRITLPAIPDTGVDEDLAVRLNGYCDHECGHIQFSDAETPGRLMAEDPRLAKFVNLLEDIRIEGLQGQKYAGAHQNIEYLNNKHFGEIREHAEASGEDVASIHKFYVEACRQLNGQNLEGPDYSEDVERDFPGLMDGVRSAKSTADIEKVARDFIKMLEEEPPPPPSGDDMDSPPDEGSGEGENEEQDDNSQVVPQNGAPGDDESDDQDDDPEGGDSEGDDPEEGDGDSEGEQEGDPGDSSGKGDGDSSEDDGSGGDGESGDEDGGEEGSGDSQDSKGGDGECDADSSESEGGEGSADSSGQPDGQEEQGKGDNSTTTENFTPSGTPNTAEECAAANGYNGNFDMEELEKAQSASDAIKEALAELQNQELRKGYIPFTKRYDKVVPVEVENERRAEAVFDELKKELGACNAQKTKIGTMFIAKTQSRWQGGREKGKIDNRRIATVKTGNTRIFKEKKISEKRDTAVTFLVDMSGSMGGQPIRTAMTSVLFFLEVLQLARVKSEVLGFTVARYLPDSINDHVREIRWGAAPDFSRYEPLRIFEVKKFNEPYNLAVKQRIGSYRSIPMSNNVDGECVEYAYQRLLQRREKRRILFVLSDGQPAADGSMAQLRGHLKQVVSKIDADPRAEVYGIGYGDHAVRHYYPNHMVIGYDEMDNLPTIMGQKLTEMLF